MSGHVRIHRSLVGHPAFRNDAEGMAFAWMVIRAAWRPTRVRYKEHVVSLQRGQLAVSVRDMAAAMDRDKAWIERLWKRLKTQDMIETHSETGITVITIRNYSEYQASADARETVDETPPETGARQGQDTEQRREEKKKISSGDKSPSPRAKARFALPSHIPADAWQGFVDMRRRIRHPLTERAMGLAVAELDKLAEDGWPPGDVLNHCTLNSYRGIFPPKDRHNGQSISAGRRQQSVTEGLWDDPAGNSQAGGGSGGALPGTGEHVH